MENLNLTENSTLSLLVDDTSFTMLMEGDDLRIDGKYDTPNEIIILNCPKELATFYESQPEVESVEKDIEDIYKYFRVILNLKPGANFFEMNHSKLNELYG